MSDTSDNGAAVGDAARADVERRGGAVVCSDAAEARLMRADGLACMTAAKLRRLLVTLLRGGDASGERAAEAIGRLGGRSEAADLESWPWEMYFPDQAAAVLSALRALPAVSSPLRDPDDVCRLGPLSLWPCSGTTVLVAEDTVALVQAADTYAGFGCYRRRGRMDEPFAPERGRVCLITSDEIHLIRPEDADDLEVVFTYDPEPQAPSRRSVTPLASCWPSALRALCGSGRGVRVGVATFLVAGRHGSPFFMGLTRGRAGVNTFRNDPAGDEGALALCVETNRSPSAVERDELVWEGGDSLRHLVRFGGLTVHLGMSSRRKVQLRSLGLARSGEAAGAPVYDLEENHAVLWAWVSGRDFGKRPPAGQRDRNRRRVRRPPEALPEYARGHIYNTMTPRRIKVTLSAVRKSASDLRNMRVCEVGRDGGVTTVRLRSLREGRTLLMNARATEDGDGVLLDQKRCRIRCPVWEAGDAAGMLEWLADEPHVVARGMTPAGRVFAVVRVANGTEDQQREAVARWAQAAGRRFPHASGCQSWLHGSVEADAELCVGALHGVNWRASALETCGFGRYQHAGEYARPVRIARTGSASASERARAYAAKVVGLDAPGGRNTALAGALLNIGDKFGAEALEEVLPSLLARSTLPAKEKGRIAARAAARFRGKPEGKYDGSPEKVTC